MAVGWGRIGISQKERASMGGAPAEAGVQAPRGCQSPRGCRAGLHLPAPLEPRSAGANQVEQRVGG